MLSSHEIKKHTLSKKIFCKGYVLNKEVINFTSNLVSFLSNIKNYDINEIKSISIRVNEVDNTIHIKIYFEDFISHIPITKPIRIIKTRKSKIIEFRNGSTTEKKLKNNNKKIFI